MAVAFRDAVTAGRTAYELGLGEVLDQASPTSPLTAFLN
jgi:thiazole synthase